MNKEKVFQETHLPRHNGMTEKEQIVWLEAELKQVRIQRNEYEQELILARRKIKQQQSDIEKYEAYINRTKSKP